MSTPDYTFPSLKDGEYNVTVIAVNNAGLAAEQNVTFTVDTKAPIIEAYTPAGSGINPRENITITFSKAISNLTITGVSGLEIWSNGNTTVTIVPTNGLAYDKSYSINITAKDKAGNVGYPIIGRSAPQVLNRAICSRPLDG